MIELFPFGDAFEWVIHSSRHSSVSCRNQLKITSFDRFHYIYKFVNKDGKYDDVNDFSYDLNNK